MKERLPYGLSAPDTQNRAALSALYWQYSAQFLHGNQLLTDLELQEVTKKTKAKLERSIEETVSRGDYVYREKDDFSLHYHIVEAYMLLAYGLLTEDKEYIALSKKMADIINTHAAPNGFLYAKDSNRPSGLGAQAYLMAGLMNTYFGNSLYAQKFFRYAFGDTFFKDEHYKNRLVWYDTSRGVDPTRYPYTMTAPPNDDISFVNMSELGLALFGEERKIALTNSNE